MLTEYGDKFRLRILVETGTSWGDTVNAMLYRFDNIFSIELSEVRFAHARKRFSRFPHVEIIHGDSGQELGNIMQHLNEPALFWLDGHYSGGGTARGRADTPIFEELTHILNAKGLRHVILVDDARCFGTDPAYPTVAQLEAFVLSKRDNLQLSVKDDIIRLAPV
jgi:hypothetical protein